MTPVDADPLLRDVAAARLLSGLSGARVYLASHDRRHWFVRKAAAAPEGSPRLLRQAAKQRAWAQLGEPFPKVPAILDEGESDGRYFFDMEAVRAADATSYLRSADYAAVRRFGDRLVAYLLAAASQPPWNPTSQCDGLFAYLADKLVQVQSSAQPLPADQFGQLMLAVHRQRASAAIEPTLCHGDFTLENLLVEANGTLWAVDLLDSPFEHYWHDVAKLHQDLDGGWYLRHQPPVARCVLEHVSRRVLQAVTTLDPGYAGVHALLMACTFVRILPYAQDPAMLEFVRQRIAHYVQRVAPG